MVKFLQKHSEKIYRHSKIISLHSLILSLYSISTTIILIVSVIYFIEPPSELVAIAVEIFLNSPIIITTVVLFSAIAYKIKVIELISHLDPHQSYPLFDFLTGIFITIIGLFGLEWAIEAIGSFRFSERRSLDLFFDLVILIGFSSVNMLFASIVTNGISRVSFNICKVILSLPRILNIPTYLVSWSRQKLKRFYHVVYTYRVVSFYATEKEISTLAAISRIFRYGLDQIEPIDRTTATVQDEERSDLVEES